MSMLDPSPLNLTISHWNQSLRALQIHLPGCSTCFYACKGMIMLFATTLERIWPSQIHLYFKPKPGPEIALDIAIHHACLSPIWKESLQLAFEMDVEMHTLADIIISGWPNDMKEVPHPLNLYCQHCESLTFEDGLSFDGEALIIPPSEREKVLGTLHQPHQGNTKTQLLACGCVFWPGIIKAIEEAAWQCETCMRFQAQNAATPLTPTPTPSCPWQKCAFDIFMLNGVDYLILADFYSKVILVHNLPAGQSNSVKGICILEEWFCDHCTPEALCTDNGPQYANAAFADCSIEWGFTHETSSLHYP